MEVPSTKRQRQRLSNACNQCRKRKVRCDEGQPQCRNCRERHEECITIDPRTQDAIAIRRRTNTKSTTTTAHTKPVSSSRAERMNQSLAQSPSIDYGSPEEMIQEDPQIQTDLNWSRGTAGYKVSPSGLVSPAGSSTHNLMSSRSSILSNSSPFSQKYEPGHQMCFYEQEMILNTTTNQKRKFIGGGTLQALTKYLDHCFERRNMETVGTRFVYGMQHAEEFPLPKLGHSPMLPLLPALPERRRYLQAFFDHIYPLFPVIDIDEFTSDINRLSSQELTSLQQEEIPQLGCAYAALAIGVDQAAGHYTETGSTYLAAAFSLWTYLISMPYLSSVQALLLLTIALRFRNKDGCGAQSLAQAIRIAHSIGLNHAQIEKKAILPGEKTRHSNNDLDSRIWWVCYCLENSYGIEIGRPVAIRDALCDQIIPIFTRGVPNFLGLWIGLSRIQSELFEVLYVRSPERKNASDLLQDIGKMDRKLCDWAANVEPEEVRPCSDLMCSPKDLPFATFISAHYYYTLICVHQAALLLDPQTYKTKVELHCLDSPNQPRLRNSETILINSARKIADLQIRLIDQAGQSTIFAATGIMTAVMILGLHLMKGSAEKRNRADLELLSVLSRHIEKQYAESGQNPRFVEAITILQLQIQQEVYSRDAVSTAGLQGLSTDTSPFANSAMITTDLLNNWNCDLAPQTHDWNSLFGDFALADPWCWLQDDGTAEMENLTGSVL